MQELVGRLTALDPEASQTLKVVTYFDALVAAGVGAEALLRGAAALSGAPVGFLGSARGLRVGQDGRRLPSPVAPPVGGRVRTVGDGAVCWLERSGDPHANDAMVLERLAIALGISEARRAAGGSGLAGAVEIAVNPHATAEERGSAIARLQLDAEPRVRAVAAPHDAEPPRDAPSAVVATRHGLVRAVLRRAEEPGSVRAETAQLGLGLALPPERLPESWASALVALRLTDDARPLVDAAELGGLLLLAEAADARSEPHPDAVTLAALDPRAIALLDALAETGSVRGAAARCGIHHSTVQERLLVLGRRLGYDPRSPQGRTRYAVARVLVTLSVAPNPH
ncbi:helix-turn-helix domain-containing protein [Agromyces soli]|uniref:Helix-turn-helix domain-containing protein n=1 Tax=Agromyces soli TaxID=659012 RepID=A0ABY4AZM7_9MICO|nr:helix-turn-helix domain-containing protein [Agromyces soli]UOE27216.1 helix-turn-helix domain-containing protein [Agromyces soli]